MILYVGLTQPVDKNTEEKIEAKILEWFQKSGEKLGLVGVFPYDPIVMEYAIDIGEHTPQPIAKSLERWIRRLNLDVLFSFNRAIFPPGYPPHHILKAKLSQVIKGAAHNPLHPSRLGIELTHTPGAKPSDGLNG